MARTSSQFIYRSLRQQIESHGLIPDTRLPSEAYLAANLKASRMTVRKALAQLETEGLIYCRPGVGSFIRQRTVEPVARQAVRLGIAGHSGGMLTWPYYRTRLQETIRQACRLYNCEPLFMSEDEFFTGEADAFLVPMMRMEDYPRVQALARRRPVLLLNRICDDEAVSTVGVDYAEATAQVIRQMLLNGVRRILFAGGRVENVGVDYPHYMREQGYRLGHARGGVPVDERLILSVDADCRQMVEALVREQPEVVFISGEVLALNTITAIEVALPRMNRKPALFGFDDLQDFALGDLRISYGQMPLAAMCCRAIKHLAALARREDGPSVIREIFPMSYHITGYPLIT